MHLGNVFPIGTISRADSSNDCNAG